MTRISTYRICWMALALWWLSSCQVTKLLYEDEVLITKYRIEGVEKVHRDEIKDLIRPRPNRKFLGLFRSKAWIQLRATRGRQTNFRQNLNNSFGEAPALLDTVRLQEGLINVERYLHDKGFFKRTVSTQIDTHGRRKKKAVVQLNIEAGPQYRFKNIEYEPTHSPIDEFVRFHMYESREFNLRGGQPYDADQLVRTRTALTSYLREQGFFYFNRDLVYFEIDSAAGNHQVDVRIRVKRPREDFFFEQFVFDTVIVNVDYQIYQTGRDTLERDTVERRFFYFVDRKPPTIRKDILVYNMLFRRDVMFSESAMRLTQSRIADLRVFGYNNIRILPNDSARKLNVLVNLTPSPRRQLKLDSEVSTNSISLFGIAGSVTETRRNVFKGAELLEIRANAGIESQQNVTATDVLSRTTFNTLEYGLSVALTIPRFLYPFDGWNVRYYTAPRTRFGISYNRQIRLDFTREVLQANVGYLWMNRARERFEFFPAEVSLARTARISQNLSDLLTEINDPFLQFSFTNYINLASRLAYAVDNLNLRGTFMRANLEWAGNTLHSIYSLFDIQDGVNPRRFAGLPYFQYVRSDVEYRKYWKHGQASTLASRIFVGAGLPLQNSIIMPLEKRYFAGGTNSIRAWLARSVGPGSFGSYGLRSLDQFGEIRLEGNIEERFPIFGNFKGAVFLDAGNIWTLKDTTAIKKDLANFSFNRFYREIAVGTGFGIRYDFGYFVVRVDVGVKLHDPAFLPGQRWVATQMFDAEWRNNTWRSQLTNDPPSAGRYRFSSLVVGINYPF